MENTKEEKKNIFNWNKGNVESLLEKKAIVYLVILSILLVYFSLFAIHDIAERASLKDTKSPTIIDPGNNNNNNNNNNQNNGTNNNGDNGNNGNAGNNGGNSGDNGNKDDNEPSIVDNSDRFRIMEGTKEWSELKELKIFNNGYFNGESKIAPGVSGKYNFTVENFGNTTMKYDISFTPENPYNINLKFKLKQNGNYIAGNESTWVNGSDMSIVDRIINANAKDVYTIEWKWIDAPNDTEVGETDGAYYKLHVKAYAEEVK